MMIDESRFYRALLRQRLSAFVQKAFLTLEPGTDYKHSWHIDHLCWQLARVAAGAEVDEVDHRFGRLHHLADGA